MFTMNMEGTKWTIFNVAVNLFADKGYANVSIRDIAATAKIRPSSIYYHFASKNDILETVIEYYDYYHNLFVPRLEDLLPYVETEPPAKVLHRLIVRYEPEMQEMMDKVFLIVTIEAFNGNEHAEAIIDRNIFESPKNTLQSLLMKMLQLGKISQVDMDAFTLAYSSLCHSSALRMLSNNPVHWDEWRRCVEMLFATIT